MKQLRAPTQTAGLAERTKFPLFVRECGSIEKWEGDGAGRQTMILSATSARSMPQLECDQQSLAIILADRGLRIVRVLGNSYVMGHGSYPR
jgi:hypothetical protein